jgi:hypothetical protein
MLLGGKGITKVCAIWLQPGVSSSFQVDLLVVCVCYLLWNFKRKVMCIPTHAIIVKMSMGVVICVVYGWAWDNASTQSWSFNMPYLTFNFLNMLNRF